MKKNISASSIFQLALLVLIFGLVHCGGSDASWERSESPLVLFAAASTTDAAEEILQEFEKRQGVEVRRNFAASATLAQQILNGAAADVFLSAHREWVDFLAAQGLLARHRLLLGNRLVVIAPVDGRIPIEEPRHLLDERITHLSLADPEAVPAGMYARQALTALGLWEALQPRVIRAIDVRHALLLVENQEAEAGLVYATDAALSSRVRMAMQLEENLTEPICYPLALVGSSPRTGALQLFDFFSSPHAGAVFQRYGFLLIEQDSRCSTSQGRG